MTAHPPRRTGRTWRDVLTRPARGRARGDRAVVHPPRSGSPDGVVGQAAGRHPGDMSVDRAAGRTRGSVSVEVAVLAPAFLALLMLAGVAGRVAVADEAVEAAAHDAARAASIARDAGTAESAARTAARRQLDWRGLNCTSAPQVTVWGSTSNSDHTSLSTAFRAAARRAGEHLGPGALHGLLRRHALPRAADGRQTGRGHLRLPAGPLPEPAVTARPTGDEGRISLFLAVTMIGVLAIIGVAYDGAGQLRTLQRADDLAAEAARSGGQVIDRAAAIEGRPKVIDEPGARAAVTQYLRGNSDVTGQQVSFPVVAGEKQIRVRVTVVYRRHMLGLIGMDRTVTVSGEATARSLTDRP